MKAKLSLDETEREIEVVRHGDQLRITLDGETYACRLVYQDGPTFILEHDGRLLRAAGTVQGDDRRLWHDGALIAYKRVRHAVAGAGEGDAGTLSASIPAVVTDVLVQVGQRVASGEKLILLESMKMVIPVSAPHDGVVTAIECDAGDAVEAGVPLIEVSELID